MIEEKIKNRTDNDLLDMIENYNQYQDSFVLAAYHELKRRNIDFDETTIQSFINRQNEKQSQIEEEIKKQKVIIDNLHPNIKKGIYVLLSIIVIRIILAIFTTSSSLTVGFITIPYLAEIINIIGLGLIAHLLNKGYIKYRYLFLYGFLISLFLEIIFEVNIIIEHGLSYFMIFHIIFIGIRFLGVYYLFNKQTNNWYKEIINAP